MSVPLSVMVITRNASRATEACLGSLIACQAALAAPGRGVEFILLDDCSLESTNPAMQFPQFRAQTSWPVTAFRFRSRQHYAAAMAYAMSLAKGDVLFISHDMMLTPDCVGELFELAEKEPTFGVFRPRSGHMDFATKMQLAPGAVVETFEQAAQFAAEVRREFAGQVVGWPALIGDALFIRRGVIERIGVFDTRFYGFWSDLDYGVRVQRAGWRHGIAAGAWLHHSGSASGLENWAHGEIAEQNHREMMADSSAAYDVFRRKWGEHLLPQHMNEMDAHHYRALRTAPPPPGGEYQRPVTVTESVAELI